MSTARPVDAELEAGAARRAARVVPEARHWRRARALVDYAQKQGTDAFGDVVFDTFPDDLPAVIYCLSRMANPDEPAPASRRVGRPPLPTSQPYTEEEAREAHRLAARGVKTRWVVEGNRVYARMRKAAQRVNGS